MRDRNVRPLGALAGAFVALVAASACGGSTLPTLPTPVAATWQFFTVTLAPGGQGASTFSVPSTSTIGLTLASVVPADGQPILPTLRLVLGTASGVACSATTTKDVTPGWSAQIQTQLNAGNYCLSVTDATGALVSATAVTVRVTTSATAPTTSPNTNTDLFSNTLLKNGSTMHEFAAGFGGTASIDLTTAGDGTIALALGAGVWDGAACRLLTLMNTTASATPQINQVIDGGRYCMTIADVGQLTQPIAIGATIVRP